MNFSKKPSDAEIDNWLDSDIEELKEVALKKVGLDQSELVSETLAITGPIVWSVPGIPEKDIVAKKGKDEMARFGCYNVHVIFFTENQISAYSTNYNFLKKVPLNEGTDEYFYKDVVSVSTKTASTNHHLPNGQKLEQSEQFTLTTSGATSIEVILSDPRITEFTKGGRIQNSRAEQAVNSIRAMLRQKKAAVPA